MGRQSQADSQVQQQVSRPKRKATNAHIFRYLQTRNPSKLEENDLKRALEVSLEECPDFWPEDSASCSSSDQSNAASLSSSSSSSTSSSASCVSLSSTAQGSTAHHQASSEKRRPNSTSRKATHQSQRICNSRKYPANHGGGSRLSTRGTNHCSCQANYPTAHPNCCPMLSARNRFKPVAKRNVYSEADYFHEGIMDYIEYQLYEMAKARKTDKN